MMKYSQILRRLSAGFLALVSVSSPLPAAGFARVPSARVAAPKHMLFRVRGPNGATVYLLGSVHLLSPDAAKLPDAVDSAFAHAKTIAFETSLDSVQMRAQELFAKARYSGGATLKSSLSPAGWAKAESILRSYGIPIEQVDTYKPWFISIILSQVVMQKANFQAQYGVDMQLNERAKSAKKSVIGLESVDFQLNLFDSIQPDEQERMITGNKGPEQSAKQLARIKEAWQAGDLAGLERVFDESRDESPRMIDIMLNNRNRSWMPKIEDLLNGKDDALVVVGAAHLVGKAGVLELLRARGFVVEQL